MFAESEWNPLKGGESVFVVFEQGYRQRSFKFYSKNGREGPSFCSANEDILLLKVANILVNSRFGSKWNRPEEMKEILKRP